MSLLESLRNGRGSQLTASGASSRRFLRSRSADRLSPDRIAAALGTPPAAQPAEVLSRSAGKPEPVVPLRVVPPPVVPLFVVPPPAVALSDRPDTGRHRGRAEQLVGWVPQPPAAADRRRHGRAPGTPSESVFVGMAQRQQAREVAVHVVPESGRHRRPAPPKRTMFSVPAAVLGTGARSQRLVVVGVVVLLMAMAAMLGVRAALERPLAHPELVATTAQSQLGGQTLESGAVQIPPPAGVR